MKETYIVTIQTPKTKLQDIVLLIKYLVLMGFLKTLLEYKINYLLVLVQL